MSRGLPPLLLLLLLLLGPLPAAGHGGKYSREKNEPELPPKRDPGGEFRMEKLNQLWEKARRVSGVGPPPPGGRRGLGHLCLGGPRGQGHLYLRVHGARASFIPWVCRASVTSVSGVLGASVIFIWGYTGPGPPVSRGSAGPESPLISRDGWSAWPKLPLTGGAYSP